jgi:hypothetical protein
MPRHCSICSHPSREKIDVLLLNGESARTVARRFQTSHSALYRHAKLHLASQIRVALEAREVSHGGRLVDQLQDLQETAKQLLHLAESKGDVKTALACVRELARLILAKHSGNMRPSQVKVKVAEPLDPASLRRMAAAYLGRHEHDEGEGSEGSDQDPGGDEKKTDGKDENEDGKDSGVSDERKGDEP